MTAPVLLSDADVLYVVQTLGTPAKAAAALGMARSAIDRRLRQLGVTFTRNGVSALPLAANLQRHFADIYKVDHCPTGACIGQEIPFAI